jgi:hypothetical protein
MMRMITITPRMNTMNSPPKTERITARMIVVELSDELKVGAVFVPLTTGVGLILFVAFPLEELV